MQRRDAVKKDSVIWMPQHEKPSATVLRTRRRADTCTAACLEILTGTMHTEVPRDTICITHRIYELHMSSLACNLVDSNTWNR